MKFTIGSLAAVLAIIASTSAQNYDQSKPFFLVVQSHDSKFNGTALEAGHEGAAIEGLCPGAPPNATVNYNTFQLNNTDDEFLVDSSLGTPGVLTWNLPSGNLTCMSELYAQCAC